MPANNHNAEARRELAERLNDARSLKIDLCLDDPAIDRFVDNLLCELMEHHGLTGQRAKLRINLKLVLLNLFVNSKYLGHRDTKFSRRKGVYGLPSRYNPLGISFLLVRVVDALRRSGDIEHHMGFHVADGEGGKLSRMRAMEKLLERFRQGTIDSRSRIYTDPNSECIILRSKSTKTTTKGRAIDYADTNRIRSMRTFLQDYNRMLANAQIALNPSATRAANDNSISYIDHLPRFVRRIFNGSFRLGGRFHGGWWQKLNKDQRSRILIDGEPVIELDFSGIHIRILYALAGELETASRLEDPYQVLELEQSTRMRDLIKSAYLIAINSKSLASAVNALRMKINIKEREKFRWVRDSSVNLRGLLRSFSKQHEPIRQSLFSDQGLKLQFIDSCIAEYVIREMMEQGIVTLCVHDSFIVQARHVSALYRSMQRAFMRLLQFVGQNRLLEPTKIKAKGVHAEEINMANDLYRDQIGSYPAELFYDPYRQPGMAA